MPDAIPSLTIKTNYKLCPSHAAEEVSCEASFPFHYRYDLRNMPYSTFGKKSRQKLTVLFWYQCRKKQQEKQTKALALRSCSRDDNNKKKAR